MTRHTLWISLAATCLALSVIGCDGGGKSGGSAPPVPSGGQVLRLAQMAEPTRLDPAKVEDGPTIELLMQVYEGLITWSTDNQPVAAIAEKWETSNGGRTYTFHLKEGVKFHNGRPVTAADFVYSITRSLDPATASPVAMVYLDDLVGAREFNEGKSKELKSVEAPDERTLKLTIDKPKAYFLSKLTYPTAYVVCKEAIEKTGGKVDETSMVGTGPFKLAEYSRGDRLLLDANPDYHEGAPKLARIERRILLDANTRHDKFEAGELDIADVGMAAYRADKANPDLAPNLKLFERPATYYLALNQDAFPPFKDKRVREAFARAVDKASIIKNVHEGVPQLAEGIVPAGVPGYDSNFKGYQYDPAKAKQLLAEAGYPDGKGFPALTLSFRASVEDIKNTAVAVQADLQKNLGIDVQLDETEWTTFLNKRKQGTMPFYFLRWMADYLDPQNFLSTMLYTKVPQNTLGYSNPQFDKLCDQADVEQDQAKRFQLYRQAEKIAVADAPWIPIYFQKDVELWNPKLSGVEDMLMGHLPHKRTTLAP